MWVDGWVCALYVVTTPSSEWFPSCIMANNAYPEKKKTEITKTQRANKQTNRIEVAEI